MSVPGYGANTSPVTSGYPCCDNLLDRVAPLKQTKLVFTVDAQGVRLWLESTATRRGRGGRWRQWRGPSLSGREPARVAERQLGRTGGFEGRSLQGRSEVAAGFNRGPSELASRFTLDASEKIWLIFKMKDFKVKYLIK